VEFTTGCHIPDVNSGLRAFKRSMVLSLLGADELCNGFSFTTTLTLLSHLNGKLIWYEPIPYLKRVGPSKVRFIRDTLRTLKYITESIVRYDPVKFFLLLSFFPFLLGLIAMMWLGPNAFFTGILWSVLIFALGPLAYALRKINHTTSTLVERGEG
jgi:polyisoprenyl-phosphate glycosyltransferase